MTERGVEAPWPPDVTLHGEHASLVPLTPAHGEALGEAVKDGELWKLWYTNVASPVDMAADIDARLAKRARGSCLPFTVIQDAGGRPVGMTTYMNIDPVDRRLEIGATWYRRSVQRTAVNTECKFLLLRHAFEALDCIAVEFRTHFFNLASRRAIERLGARFDGILRNHSRDRNGNLRDTCVYSIIASEWPTVRGHLEWGLQRPQGGDAL
ncbi:MAG: GNAT family N-acetyltransferase [Caulobacteraceae bacterium]|nr:GNAT family N-acetyltransferase [Caulobacteraceae bacterium]